MRHGRHFLLSVLTLGLWLPIWFIMWVVDLFRPHPAMRRRS